MIRSFFVRIGSLNKLEVFLVSILLFSLAMDLGVGCVVYGYLLLRIEHLSFLQHDI